MSYTKNLHGRQDDRTIEDSRFCVYWLLLRPLQKAGGKAKVLELEHFADARAGRPVMLLCDYLLFVAFCLIYIQLAHYRTRRLKGGK